MHSVVAAAILSASLFAQGAAAQCLAAEVQADASVAPEASSLRSGALMAVNMSHPPAERIQAARHGDNLIKTAVAAQPGVMRDAPPVVRRQPVEVDTSGGDNAAEADASSAMLLAALALMSGIALRRYSSGRE